MATINEEQTKNATQDEKLTKLIQLLNDNATKLDVPFIEILYCKINTKIHNINHKNHLKLMKLFFTKLKKLLNNENFNEAEKLMTEAENYKNYSWFSGNLYGLFHGNIVANNYEVVGWLLQYASKYLEKSHVHNKFIDICERQDLRMAEIFSNFDPIKYRFTTKIVETIDE